MDKRLKISEIAARTQLSVSTVSRVLAGKANTSEKARNQSAGVRAGAGRHGWDGGRQAVAE
ncbi:transcriptional regulator [Citrobacter koseri]|nr:transcriptional regulator [Citrobacter koseri]